MASMKPSASSSRDVSPVPAKSQPIDPYRVISSHIKKPILPLLPQAEPLLTNLLSLDPATYSARLSGKTLLTIPDTTSAKSSILVQGRKRNRGNLLERSKAREKHEHAVKEREAIGLVGMRKVKKRLGSVTGRGQKISYKDILPLHYLHIIYLTKLLALPPLPSSIPKTLPQMNPEPLQSKISKADFTGIHLSVVAAKNAALKDISGIVIEETAETFRLVGTDDRVRVIPKEGSLFRLSFPAYIPPVLPTVPECETSSPYPQDLTHHLQICPRMELDLLGSSFAYRSVDRAGRKFRPAQGGGGGSGWGSEWVGHVVNIGKTLSKLESHLDSSIYQTQDGKEIRKRSKSRRKDPPARGNA
nr:ribonuclease P protein subunit POP4 [Cryptococcus depauperatus CBS 7855]